MNTNELSFPSKLTGSVLRLLLLIAMVIYGVVLFCTVFYVFDYAIYEQYLAVIDEPAMLFGGILYYIILVVFLIWIVNVHRAMKQRHPRYPIGIGGGIVRMLPLVNLWGIDSTFSNISSYLYGYQSIRRAAVLIQRMILPLYLVFFIGNGLNRYIVQNPFDASDGVILAGAVFDALSVGVYWFLAQTIHRALTDMYAIEQEEPLSESSPAAPTEAAVTEDAPAP